MSSTRSWTIPARAALTATALAFALAVVCHAWVGDDAWITLRTVENAAQGHGLVWNLAERVQTYTHPLWMLILLGAHLVTGELYLTTMVVSLVVSFASAALLARRGVGSVPGAALALGLCAASRAFVDYSTSGLENPLTHLFIVLFWVRYQRRPWEKTARRIFDLTLVAALAGTNRLDTVLLFAPAITVELLRFRKVRAVLAAAAALAPLLAWLAFAVVYYGFAWPNTAFAKLNTAIPRRLLEAQGLSYLADSLSRDPLTLVIGAAGVLGALRQRRWRDVAFGAGAVLYVVYTVRVGGDFMSGRFYTAPFLVGLLLLVRTLERGDPRFQPQVTDARGVLARLPLVLVLALPGNFVGFLDKPGPLTWDEMVRHGIADERAYWAPHHGMWAALRGEAAAQKSLARRERLPGVHLRGDIGFPGIAAGPQTHVVDVLALSDPLLARLPTHNEWRIGHYGRVIPLGYVESLETGQNLLVDRDLGALMDRLWVVTRGPIWSRERLAEVWRFNTGAYRHLVDRRFYRFPPVEEVPVGVLGDAAPGARWDASGTRPLYRYGTVFRLPEARRGASFVAVVACGNTYAFQLASGPEHHGEVLAKTRKCKRRTLTRVEVDVPARAAERGWDRILVKPIEETGESSIASISPPSSDDVRSVGLRKAVR